MEAEPLKLNEGSVARMDEKTRETNNMQLLQDTFIIEQLQVLSEGKATGPMKIRGVFGRCNEKNNNGRIYPTAVLESQLEKVKPLILERRLCGELDHPQNDTVKLSNASHLVTKLEMKGNDLIGEAEILKTPAGLTAKALVEGGVKIGISSRGMGTLSEDHNGDKIVNEDFRLVTFDLVADPSTRGAFPGLSESTESKFVRESQSKLKKESNFVTMLESKMRDAYDPWIEEAKTKKKLTKKQSEKMDVEPKGGDGDIDSKDLVKLRAGHDKFEEAMKLVKADGHWHRIAEAILEAFDDGSKGSSDQQQIALLRRIRREQVKGKLFKGVGTGTARAEKAKGKKAAKRGGRRKQDKKGTASDRRSGGRRVDAGTSYKQFGNIIMEEFDPEKEKDKTSDVATERRPEGVLSRSLRHRSERKQASRLAGDARKARSKGIRSDARATAKAGVESDAIGQKGSLAKKVRAAKDATTMKRVQHQQTNRQARQRDKISSAEPGSSRSQGLGGSAREKAADLAGGISKLPGRLKKLPGKVIDKAVKARDDRAAKKEATSYKQIGSMLAEMLKN
tara:strand:- start:8205 stop:9896 length:1692 start_codon:yes stop_codon:yes gene_type:complete